jgi:hypothetical protein
MPTLHEQLRDLIPRLEPQFGFTCCYYFNNTTPVALTDEDIVPLKMYFRPEKDARVKRLLGYSVKRPSPVTPAVAHPVGKGVCIAVVYQWASRILAGHDAEDQSWHRGNAALCEPAAETIALQTRYEARFLRRAERKVYGTDGSTLAAPEVHAAQKLARELTVAMTGTQDVGTSDVGTVGFAGLAARAPHALSLRVPTGSHAIGIAGATRGGGNALYLMDPNVGLLRFAGAAQFDAFLPLWIGTINRATETRIVELRRP